MSGVKYTYNPKTCKYEPWYLKGRALQDQVALFIGLSLLLAGGFFYAFVSNFDSLNEQLLRTGEPYFKNEVADPRGQNSPCIFRAKCSCRKRRQNVSGYP